ncbi:MAG: ornithine cyclodeaminase family protein, partial [Planctomycetes bacterium]|nr:ornithine cyclodeaminase family protein [Planctomycetota bacterium]
FIDEMSGKFSHLDFVACNSPAEMAKGCDVIVSAIPIVAEPNPPMNEETFPEGCLAVSLDYDSAWTSGAMKAADKFVSDDINQLLTTKAHGVYFAGIPEEIYADIGELAAGKKPGRQNDNERIFSMNMGIAVDDMATAKIIYQKAVEMNIGTMLPL